MLSKSDKIIILEYAKKYKLKKIILFGSSLDKLDANDIDIAVEGLAPELFFKFGGELYMNLSKPVDIIDLSEKCLFTDLIKRDGMILYG